MIPFMISYVVAFLVFALIAIWYIWPNIKDRPAKAALTPLLLYSCLRVNGLMFLMPGLVSTALPAGFAVPTAYGDFTAVMLGLISLFLVRTESFLALPMVWLFNIEGTLDLVYANFATFKYHVDPAQLGASYYLAAINVPAEMIVHVTIFAYLLRVARRPGPKLS
ncbi:MAG: hypothetical protein AB1508_06820 [Pseudomonadota bacterium]